MTEFGAVVSRGQFVFAKCDKFGAVVLVFCMRLDLITAARDRER